MTGLAREVATAFDLRVRRRSRARRSPTVRAGARSSRRAAGRRPHARPQAIPVAIENDGCGRYALAVARRQRGAVAGVARRSARRRRHPADQQHRRRDQLRDARDGHPMHAFDAAQTRRAGDSRPPRPAGRKARRPSTGRRAALDASMLVIADRDRPVAIAGDHGRRELGGVERDDADRARKRLVAARRRCAGRAGGCRSRPKPRPGSSEAPTSTRRYGRSRGRSRSSRRLARRRPKRPCSMSIRGRPRPWSVELRRDHLERLLGDAVPDCRGRANPHAPRLRGHQDRRKAGGLLCQRFASTYAGRPTSSRRSGAIGGSIGFPRRSRPCDRRHARPRRRSRTGRTVRRVLTGAGLQEAVTFTFMEHAAAAPFVADATSLVAIANPLSEKFAVLRPSLLPGLLDALIYSRRRETADVRLFEAGSVFDAAGERQAVGWVMTGNRASHWSGRRRSARFLRREGHGGAAGAAPSARLVEAEVVELPWLRARPGGAAPWRGRRWWIRARRHRPDSSGDRRRARAGRRRARSSPAKSTWRRSSRRGAHATSASPRCRGIRRLFATSRSSSTNACQPHRFVALSGRSRR